MLLTDRAEIYHIQNGVDFRVTHSADLRDMQRNKGVLQIDVSESLRTVLQDGQLRAIGGGVASDCEGVAKTKKKEYFT